MLHVSVHAAANGIYRISSNNSNGF